MFQDGPLALLIDQNCSIYDYNQFESWITHKSCPRCSSEDIEVELRTIFDAEQYIVGDAVNCKCLSCSNQFYHQRNYR